MFHSNVLFVFVVTYWLCSIGDCRVVSLQSHVISGHKSELDCSQFSNDHDVLRQLPFPVQVNPATYGNNEKSVVKMSDDGTFVEWITIRNEDLVPLSLFCLSNVTSLGIVLTPFENDTIPDALANLKTLKFLSIQSTLIKKMTTQLATLTNLEVISIFNCSLTHLPDINNLHKLKSLYLPDNNLIEIDEFQGFNLELLDLSGNNLTEIPILKNKEDLIALSLNKNPLKNAEPIILYPNLKYLYLAYATLTSIPPAIDKLQELEYLLLFDNQLTDLPASILNLPKLEQFFVVGNLFSPDKIESIKEAFKKHLPTTNLII